MGEKVTLSESGEPVGWHPEDKRMEGREPDAWGALRRNASAHREWQAEERNRTLKVKSKTQVEYLPEISSEVREEYVIEFYEHSGRYMDSGYSLEEADRLTLDDLGCCEYWAWRQNPEHESEEGVYRRGKGTPTVVYPEIREEIESWVEEPVEV